MKPGDQLVFVGFGAGLTWAACAIQWSVPTDRHEADWWRSTRRQVGYQAAAARSMWRRAVRWVYHVWPNDPEAAPLPVEEPPKEVETPTNGAGHSGDD